MKRRFVIDCDTGTDDAIALAAAFGCDEIEILGITSVNGNVAEQYTSQNNLDLCDYLGVHYPVCHGAVLPLSGGVEASHDLTHGKTGLGSLTLPPAHSSFDPRIASTFIHDMAVQEKGELELLVTGPMTNIALALILYPDLPGLIKHIYFMGGAVYGGNVSPTAEFNIWEDPEAGHTVLDSGIPLTMVGLDVTLKAAMIKEDVDELRAHGSTASNFTADMLEFMLERCRKGGEDALMHDALALAAAVYPECLSFEEYWVDVETKGQYTRGHTFADVRHRTGHQPNVRVAMNIDVPMFRHWLVQKVNSFKA